MDSITKISIRLACTDLVARYALSVNQNRADIFASLFTPDAVWQRPNVPALNGNQEIHAFIASELAKARVIRHITGVPVIDIIDENHAKGWSQTVVFHLKGISQELPVNGAAPEMAVDYEDQYQRVNGQWLIARRDTTVVFIDPANQ